MDAAVVELDALPDPVRSAAQHHHLSTLRDRDLIASRIGRVVVARVVYPRNLHGLVSVPHAQSQSLRADRVLVHAEQLGQVAVCETVLLGAHQKVVGQRPAPGGEDLLLQPDQFGHLL